MAKYKFINFCIKMKSINLVIYFLTFYNVKPFFFALTINYCTLSMMKEKMMTGKK